MRKRSQTIQADTYEEYLELSIAHSIQIDNHNATTPQSPYCYYAYPPERNDRQFSPTLMENDEDCFLGSHEPENFTYCETKGEYCDELRTPSTENTDSDSRILSYGSMTDGENWPMVSSELKSLVNVERTRMYKAMIVGQAGVGRHRLLNAGFGNTHEEGKLRNTFDLVIKHQNQGGCANTYKFWLRDPSDEKIEPLIKVYYKSINLYIFIYRIDDRKSFECLDKAIGKVRKEVSGENFKGLLIANCSNGRAEERKVSHEEGVELKQKYKLSQFLETKYSSEALEKVLFDFIDSRNCKKTAMED